MMLMPNNPFPMRKKPKTKNQREENNVRVQIQNKKKQAISNGNNTIHAAMPYRENALIANAKA
jgi:hypothetical protein